MHVIQKKNSFDYDCNISRQNLALDQYEMLWFSHYRFLTIFNENF